ncbi:DUF4190 domain-containing protein [Gordonia sp. CPCC 205333]|uniref:DUF4190 domain-containing protein n=1 Tax=Gordonia sp. CPCC 205333 TaxID=3140790 RepID=UPI003AF3BC7D
MSQPGPPNWDPQQQSNPPQQGYQPQPSYPSQQGYSSPVDPNQGYQPQQGYSPPGGPQWGNQPSGAPYGYAPPPPNPASQTTNGLAIAALVTGLIPIICAGLLGVIFGIVALNQIKTRGQKGRGLAIAGIVCGALWFVGLLVLGAVTDVLDDDDRASGSDSSKFAIPSFTVPVVPSTGIDVSVGDCLSELDLSKKNSAGESKVTDLDVVSCTTSHRAEVFYEITLTGTSAPTATEAEQKAQQCVDQLSVYAPTAATESDVEVSYVYPMASSWARGDRDFSCVATFTTPRTSSIKGR